MEATFQVPKNPSPQVKTILHYLDLVKVFDLDGLDKLFADDFVQSTRPLSLNVPSRTKEEDLAFLKGLSVTMKGRHLEITFYDVVESPPGKVWVHVALHGEPPKGKAFTIECIYMFTLIEHLGVHKVKGVIDFLDSRAFIEMNEGN
ncbi:hypothetical protein BGW80DRAFT_1443977 [Lactifluus volemus]|nr:hypothetical protein BGW80DRAFT_1443977 [Lactifluus volemus]